MKKRFISMLTAIIMIVGLVGVMPMVSAGAWSYNASAAVSYASSHWNDGKGLCAEFVSDCLAAGGVSGPWNISCGSLINNLVNGGYGTKYQLATSGGAIPMSSNSGKLSAGDPIFYYCNKCGVYPHVVLCGGSTGGYATAYGHNAAWNNKKVWNSFSSGTHKGHSMTMYSFHMSGHTCDSNNSYISKNATCTSTGTRTYTCSVCGKTTRTETISALGHSYGGWTTTKESTCTEVGSKYQSCSRCGYKNTQSISKKSHSYTTSDIKPKSTSEKGYTDHTCTMCGNNYKDNYIELKSDGYYYGEKLPSWADNSNYTVEYKCHSEKIATTSPGDGWVNSGVSRVEWQNSGPLYENYFYELPTSDSRVLSKIRYFHFCGPKAGTKVNYEMRDNYVHWDQVDWDSVSVASQGMDGNIPYYLLNWNNGSGRVYCKSGVTCDGSNGTHGNRAYAWYRIYVYQDRTKITYYKFTKDTNWSNTKDSSASSVEMRFKQKVCTNHSYGDWTTTKPATCTTAGTKTRKCSICGNTETQTIAATGHKYSTEWTIDKTAACTEKGSKSHHCTVCGDKKDVTEIAATGHKYVTSVVNPTETEQGYTLHKCSVCGDSYKDNYVDPVKPEEPTNPPASNDFDYTIFADGTVEITGYTGDVTNLTIPSEIDGMTVISIGDYAFAYCDNLVWVTIPDSVENIGYCAFYNCSNLESVETNLLDSIRYIGDWAFENCFALEEVTIPRSVIEIGEGAFGYYYNEDEGYDYILDYVTICCFSDTVAHWYAIDNGFDYILLDDEQMIGDLSGDGEITTADVGIINSFARGVTNPTPDQLALADANGDGEITTADVGIINNIARGI